MSANTPKPIGGTDFITKAPPHGFGMRFHVHDDGHISGKIRIQADKQGPPGHVHGGALIALLDEAMGATAWYAGHQVVAVHLSFDLKAAVPLDTEITVQGEIQSKDGRKIWTISRVMLPDGRVAVEGRGLFLESPQFFEESGNISPFTPLEE
ncbi:MAG: PaaI family thioesterase [Anaerolineae bacterium]|jgi:acyl-coenzyme A thioesterase PaaI-like protein|nr:PaaI family thioesterase [Anaerolineae bacterium]